MGSKSSKGTAVHLEKICKTYFRGQERIDALKNVSLTIDQGEFAVIIGPSGGGKTTLLHIMGGLERPTSGITSINNVKINDLDEARLSRFRSENIGFVFQFYNLIPSLSAIDNTALPLVAQGFMRKEANRKANEILERVGMDGRKNHKPAELSGGEQQRVTIARALISQPAVILADEPTGNLDHQATEEIIHLLTVINRELHTTVLVTTHNHRFISAANSLFDLSNGVLNEFHPKTADI